MLLLPVAIAMMTLPLIAGELYMGRGALVSVGQRGRWRSWRSRLAPLISCSLIIVFAFAVALAGAMISQSIPVGLGVLLVFIAAIGGGALRVHARRERSRRSSRSVPRNRWTIEGLAALPHGGGLELVAAVVGAIVPSSATVVAAADTERLARVYARFGGFTAYDGAPLLLHRP